MSDETDKYIFKAISPDTFEVVEFEVEVPDLSKLESELKEPVSPLVPENVIEARTQDILSVESQILLVEAECQTAIAKYNEWLDWWDVDSVNLSSEDRDAKWQLVIQAYEAAVYKLKHFASVKGVNSICHPSLPKILVPTQERCKTKRVWAKPMLLKKSVSQLTPNVITSKIGIFSQFVVTLILGFPLIVGAALFAISLYLSIFSCLILYLILFFWFKSHREALAIRRCEEERRRQLYLRCRQINPNAPETTNAMSSWYQAKAELQVLEWYKQSSDNIDE